MVSITISFRPPTKLFSVSPQAYFILLWCHKMEEGLEADNTIIKKKNNFSTLKPCCSIHSHSQPYICMGGAFQMALQDTSVNQRIPFQTGMKKHYHFCTIVHLFFFTLKLKVPFLSGLPVYAESGLKTGFCVLE